MLLFKQVSSSHQDGEDEDSSLAASLSMVAKVSLTPQVAIQDIQDLQAWRGEGHQQVQKVVPVIHH